MAPEDELHRRLIRRIRETAKERRVPLSHLPDRAGVARSHFWEVLGGRKSPTLRWVARVAEALDLDPTELLVARPRR